MASPEAAFMTKEPKDGSQSGVLRYLPIALIATGACLAFFFARDYLSFSALSENVGLLTEWRDRNLVLAGAVYMLIYVLAVAFSVPGAVWLTLVGGFLFGVIAGSMMTVVAATIGAVLIFMAAKTSLGGLLREKVGSRIEKMERVFKNGEVSFLLILRLVPAVPFFIANVAPAFLGAGLRNFAWTTLVGIIPGTVVYISIGSGLGEQLSRGEAPDLGVIFEPHILGPLLGLAMLAALPLVLRRFGIGGGPSGKDTE